MPPVIVAASKSNPSIWLSEFVICFVYSERYPKEALPIICPPNPTPVDAKNADAAPDNPSIKASL